MQGLISILSQSTHFPTSHVKSPCPSLWIHYRFIFHSIIESFLLEKTHKINQSNHCTTLCIPPLITDPKHRIHTSHNHRRGWGFQPLHGSTFQGLTIPSMKILFQISNLSLSWCNLRPLPHILLLVTCEK